VTAFDVEPIRRLFARWGLVRGRAIQGLTVAGVNRLGAAVVEVTLRRGEHTIAIELRRASPEKRAVRVGEIDIAVRRVDPELEREAASVTRLFQAWLSRHGSGALFVALLEEKSPAEDRAFAEGGYQDEGEPPELDRSKRTPDARPFMRFETIDVSEVDHFPDAIREMYAGTLGGLVIRNVYAPEEMARVAAMLEAGTTDYPRTSFPARFNAHFFGRCLDGSEPELDLYLEDAERFRTETLAIFRGSAPFEDRMEETFRALAGGRAVELPRFRDRAYAPATIRILLENGQIGTHCGNEAATRPAYTHLNEIIDRGDQISFFLTLQEPEAGGELVVYSLKWTDIDGTRIVGGRSNVNDLLGEAEWMAISPRAGDLLLFDGGRYFHRVAKVKGKTTRFTIGGFMMFDRAGAKIFYWS
jgi:hypothetical protein